MSTHNIQFHDEIRNILKYLFAGAIGRISDGFKNKFESAIVNEPSVFELCRFHSLILI